MENVNSSRNVAILIYENVEILDFTGPYEVFIAGSNRGKDFNVFTVAEKEHPVIALGNLSINPNFSIENCPPPDVLIIPGGWGSRKEMKNETIINWINTVSTDTELVLSVCTGALILAKTNLIDGLKITTNRLAFNELRKVAPKSSELLEEVRYVDNGKFIFSAGVSAGLDASLYVLEKLFGEERAINTAAIMEYEWNKNQSYS